MKQSSRLKNAYLSSVSSVVYEILLVGCGLITQRMVLKAYGSTYNGIVSSISQFLSFFAVFWAGVAGSTRVALYKTLAANDTYQTNAIINANNRFFRKIGYGMLGYIAILTVVFPLIFKNEPIPSWHIAVLVLIIGISSFASASWGNTPRALLSADQKNYISKNLESIALVANAVILFVIISLGGNILVAKGGSYFVHFLIPIALALIVKNRYHIDKKIPPDNSGLKGRWDVLANSIANIVHSNVDIAFITLFCVAAEISVYSLYFTVANGLMKIVYIFTDGMEAAFGNMWAKKELPALQKNTARLEYLISSLSILLFGCMYILTVPFMQIYTASITDVNYFRPDLVLAFVLAEISMCLRTPYVILVQAAGHYKETKTGSFIEAGLNIVLTFLLVMKFGIVGAVAGTVIANMFRTIQYGVYASKHLIKRKTAILFFKMLWLACTLIAAIFLSKALLYPYLETAGSSWLCWILLGVGCFAIHIVVLLVSSLLFFRKEFFDTVKTALKAIK